MPEPLTIAGAGLAILGSKDILNKLLGPSADYLGAKTAGLVEKCDINLDGIFSKAYKKLGERADEAGSVNPRVLKHVVDEGRFVEDELVAEYYGGLLASSKTNDGLDDRGLPHLTRVKAMSVYQIRLHFFIYHSILRIFANNPANIGVQEERRKLRLYCPYTGVTSALLTQPAEATRFHSIFTHSINGLYSHGLIDNFSYGPAEHLQKAFKGATTPGFIVAPTFAGTELFLWAIGAKDPDAHSFFSQDVNLIDSPLPMLQSALAVQDPG